MEQAVLFALVDGILYFVDPKEEENKDCVVVPTHLRDELAKCA